MKWGGPARQSKMDVVRPLAGAGIEIVVVEIVPIKINPFAPSRGRELKLDEDGHVCWEDHRSPPPGGGN